MSEPTRSEILARVVEKHLPTSVDQSLCTYGKRTRSERWAADIIDAYLEGASRFGVSEDHKALKELIGAARELRMAIRALSYSGLKAIDTEILFLEDPTFLGSLEGNSRSLVIEAFECAEDLERVALALKDRRASESRASRKRNWRAASVAKQCRDIWAEEEFLGHPETFGPYVGNALAALLTEENSIQYRRYEQHRAEGAPTSDHPDAPGPFGRFLNEVLETLGVVSANGKPVSAASALRSLDQATQQNRGD